MEILKREGNFDQILKREKNQILQQIKMRAAPFKLKISKEDSDFGPCRSQEPRLKYQLNLSNGGLPLLSETL